MEVFYPLRVHVCGECYLVQLPEFQTPEQIFSDYAYFSSQSETWLDHARAYVADVSERFGQLEGAAFVNGDGNKKPDGFMNDSDIQVINTGLAANITADSLIDITGELKEGYQGVYTMNRRTVAKVRQLKGFRSSASRTTGSPCRSPTD